jgi:hypothetical protein
MGNNLGKNLSMKKKNLFATAFYAGIFATALLLTSCGGGEGGGKNNVKIEKFPKNEILGNMVNIVNEHYVLDSISDLEIKELKNKYDVKNEKEYEKYKNEYIKLTEKAEKLNADYYSAVEAEKVNLIGKSIPFEMEDDFGYEVTECKIVDVNKYGGFKMSINVKLTDPDKALAGSRRPNFNCYLQYLDKNGNIIQNRDEYIGHLFEVSLPDKNVGTEGTATSWEDIGWHSGRYAKNFANLAKVRFVKNLKK